MTTSGHFAYAATRTFFAALVEGGVNLVIASPGSRSTPLIVGAADTAGIELEIAHDERVAGFMAVGHGKVTRRPAALVCTSGSAGAHYLPAVMEAHLTGVPLIVLTADRPSELQGVGAPQTADQTRFFASFTRMTRLLADVDEATQDHMNELAAETLRHATGDRSGPVHINWPFREPLEPGPAAEFHVQTKVTGESAPGSTNPAAQRAEDPRDLIRAVDLLDDPRGVIVVGPDDLPTDSQKEVWRVAESRGWPVLADIASGLRTAGAGGFAWTEAAFSPGGLAERLAPRAVLRVGRMPTAKPFAQWLSANPTIPVVLVNLHTEVHDFTRTADVTLERGADASMLAGLESGAAVDPEWLTGWQMSSKAAEDVADSALDRNSEAAVVRRVLHALPDSTLVHLASSMPIRDADHFGGTPSAAIRVLASRGTNGIDGTVATALGEAMAAQQPTVAVLGDIALLHDFGGLLAAARSEYNLTLVVIDNDGGGIFSFLPIAAHLEPNKFERLFHTPHGTPIAALAEAAGASVATVPPQYAGSAVAAAVGHPGLSVVVVPTNTSESVEAFRAARNQISEAMLAAQG